MIEARCILPSRILLFEEEVGQTLQVFLPLAQKRNMPQDRIQPMI
jgi:hypothetical protein